MAGLMQRVAGGELDLAVPGTERRDEVGTLARALESFRFEPQVVYSEGEVTVALERFGILGFGATFDEALEDAVRELRVYAQEPFAQPMLYGATDRAAHRPWLLRFALTPPDQQAALLLEDSRPTALRPA
jgi:hypothetical protein